MGDRKRVLILGSTGFIGQNLLTKLSAEKYDIWASVRSFADYDKFTKQGIKVVRADLLNRDDINRILYSVKPDVILQYAAYTTNASDCINAPYLHSTDNAIMNSLLLRAIQEIGHPVHLIFASCSVMYKPSPLAQTEQDWDGGEEFVPSYLMVGSMKVFIEQQCKAYSRLNKNKFTVIRHSNIVGPHDKFFSSKSHLFAALVSKIIKSEDNVIELYGSGGTTLKRDVLYVDDVVELVDQAIQKQTSPYELFNCGLGQAYSIQELIDEISQQVGKNITVKWGNQPEIPTTVVLNCYKAYNELGWQPKQDLKSMVQLTVDWVQKNL